MPRFHGIKERHALDIYDAFSLGELAPSATLSLFSNRNVGNMALSNLMVAGQLACDQTSVVFQLRARTNIRPSEALTRFVHTTTVQFDIGCRPRLMSSLVDLMARRPWADYRCSACGHPEMESATPMVVPVRQNFGVRIYARPECVDALVANAVAMQDPPAVPMFWIHVEGLTTRDVG